MNLLGSLAIALSMYSKIPVPQLIWTPKRMKYTLCFFPFVGVIIGLSLWGYQKVLSVFPLSVTAYACVGTVIPILITGGIHMDGFADVTDARASYGSKEKKIEILKDPHVGAFAILGCLIYLLLYVAAFSELKSESLKTFMAVPVLCRALSGFSVVFFPKAKDSGLAAAFSEQAQKCVVGSTMMLYLMLSAVWIYITGGMIVGSACTVISGTVFLHYYRRSLREFGGITGDLAGDFLQRLELILLMAVALLMR